MNDIYFDRNGNPITPEQWAELFSNRKYQRVEQTTLSDGTFVSTVWLGLNNSWNEGPPFIFESMVFKKDREEEHCERYATEKEALAGHQRLVKKYWPRVEESHSRWDHVIEEDNGHKSVRRPEDSGNGRAVKGRASKGKKRVSRTKKVSR